MQLKKVAKSIVYLKLIYKKKAAFVIKIFFLKKIQNKSQGNKQLGSNLQTK